MIKITIIKALNLIGCHLKYTQYFVLSELWGERTKVKNTCGAICQLMGLEIHIMSYDDQVISE